MLSWNLFLSLLTALKFFTALRTRFARLSHIMLSDVEKRPFPCLFNDDDETFELKVPSVLSQPIFSADSQTLRDFSDLDQFLDQFLAQHGEAGMSKKGVRALLEEVGVIYRRDFAPPKRTLKAKVKGLGKRIYKKVKKMYDVRNARWEVFRQEFFEKYGWYPHDYMTDLARRTMYYIVKLVIQLILLGVILL